MKNLKANGKAIERKQNLLRLTPEQVVAKVQSMGFKFTFRQYKKMIGEGYIPKVNGDELIEALAKVLGCRTEFLLIADDEAA
jgi:RNase P/RNase MRP subunit p29